MRKGYEFLLEGFEALWAATTAQQGSSAAAAHASTATTATAAASPGGSCGVAGGGHASRNDHCSAAETCSPTAAASPPAAAPVLASAGPLLRTGRLSHVDELWDEQRNSSSGLQVGGGQQAVHHMLSCGFTLPSAVCCFAVGWHRTQHLAPLQLPAGCTFANNLLVLSTLVSTAGSCVVCCVEGATCCHRLHAVDLLLQVDERFSGQHLQRMVQKLAGHSWQLMYEGYSVALAARADEVASDLRGWWQQQQRALGGSPSTLQHPAATAHTTIQSTAAVADPAATSTSVAAAAAAGSLVCPDVFYTAAALADCAGGILSAVESVSGGFSAGEVLAAEPEVLLAATRRGKPVGG